MKRKLDTRAIGLDVGLAFTKWLTGAENLHYGLWDGLEVNASNLRTAQDAYSDKLFDFLPDSPQRILDIGGGAGETARKLIARGHSVDIVVPSEFLSERCRANAPEAQVWTTTFEDFTTDRRFNLCLFSESFQYIPVAESLPRCAELLEPGGFLIIADCFRPAEFAGRDHSTVGGGHAIDAFREELARQPFEMIEEIDITASVAPSVDLEQDLFNVFGMAAGRIDKELSDKRPRLRWLLNRAWRALVSERRRKRLNTRLNERTRTSDVFMDNNIYLMMKLRRR